MPLFWPSATEISFDMVEAMVRHNIIVQRFPVYQMIANGALDKATLSKLENGAVAAVVAMSPRSIRIFRDNLVVAGQASSLLGVTLIAGSSAIVAAAGDGWQAVHVAEQPRRSRLLAIAILRHRRSL